MSLQSEPCLPRPRKQLFTAAQARTGVSAARANFLINDGGGERNGRTRHV